MDAHLKPRISCMTQPTRPKAQRSADLSGWLFFRQWLKNPLGIAALSPSGRQLARQMIDELPDGARRVVELGGGTGVFTRALIDRGIASEDLFVLELNDALYEHLKDQFPQARVVNGDACDLHRLVHESGFMQNGAADAVISGLGLLSMPRSVQSAIMRSAFEVLKPNGRMIQFTYGPASPVPRELLAELGLSVRRAGFAWRNVPPASVYVFTRNRSESIRAVRAKS
jgi:phosphatidylethanolamine/phosphatidyl-N-methylethanolamine N-methyltransferase